MSAQIIPFPGARVVNPERSPETGLEFSVRPGSDNLTSEDIASIEGHLPQLRGSWSLKFLEDQGERLLAILHKSSGWEAFRRTAVVQRQGAKLSASIQSPEGHECLGMFETAILAMQAIAGTIGLGSRRTARPDESPQAGAVTGKRSRATT